MKFQTGKTDMGRGTLIIRYTDSENSKHDPVIYTDYLAACSTTSADTRVVLYEEGDYEIALDYEIKSTPRKVGPVEVVPDYYNYRTYFKFSVHNSNAMLYPFDLATGSELQNRAVAPNGFRIDLANSKDLKVDVTRTVITVNSSGKHVEDSRGTKAARDGSEYTKEGKYTIEVNNTYTKKSTTKTIFVGSDPFLVAMANTGLSARELDDTLAQGYSLGDDGSLIAPVDPEPKVEKKVADAAEVVEEEQKTEAAEQAASEIVTESSETQASSEVNTEINEDDVNEAETAENNGRSFPIVPVVVIVVLIVVILAVKKKSSRNVLQKDGSIVDLPSPGIDGQDDSKDAEQSSDEETFSDDKPVGNDDGGEKQ